MYFYLYCIIKTLFNATLYMFMKLYDMRNWLLIHLIYILTVCKKIAFMHVHVMCKAITLNLQCKCKAINFSVVLNSIMSAIVYLINTFITNSIYIYAYINHLPLYCIYEVVVWHIYAIFKENGIMIGNIDF